MQPTSYPCHFRPTPGRRLSVKRSAFTLIELLVVIAILLILLAVALPAIGLGTSEKRTREASRGVNAFLAAARDKAISSGRPFGVELHRFHAGEVTAGAGPDQRGLNSCMTLSYIEVPPPYCGDSIYSRMKITINGSGQSEIAFVGEVNSSGTNGAPDTSWPFLVRPGDRVQIGYQGHVFYINGAANADGFINNPVGCTLYSETSTWQAATDNRGVPYQVFRAPIKSGAASYQLPEGAVIDLSSSGVYGNEFIAGTVERQPVYILFGPSGGLSQIYVRPMGDPRMQAYPVTSSVFLLIGEPDKVLPVASLANWQLLSSLWVSINARTGLIQSNETAGDFNTGGPPTSLFDARRFAREKQGMGGR